MRILKQAILLVLLTTLSVASIASTITKKQVLKFHDQILKHEEAKDIKALQKLISNDAQFVFTQHKKGKKPKNITFSKRKYIRSLNNAWHYLQSRSSKILKRQVEFSKDKKSANLKIKTKVKDIYATTVVKGMSEDVFKIEMIDGKLMITGGVGEAHFD